MVADYIQAQLKMSQVQLLYAKKSHRASRTPDQGSRCPPPTSLSSRLPDGTGDTDISDTNLPKKLESFHKLAAQKGQLDLTEKLRPKLTAKRSLRFSSFPPSPERSHDLYNPSALQAYKKVIASLQEIQRQDDFKRSIKSKGSEINLTKPFEYFPTPTGSERICYIELKNNSLYPVTYKVTANRADLYEIIPKTAWIPPGRTWKMSVKFLGGNMDQNNLENDRIIITTYAKIDHCGNNPAADFPKLDKMSPAAITVFPIKDFVIHPCSIIPQSCNAFPSLVSMPLCDMDAVKGNYSHDTRLALLKQRNDAEKLFDCMQNEAAKSTRQLKILRRKNYRVGTLFRLVSYIILVGLMGLTVYFVSSQENLRREAEAKKKTGNFFLTSSVHYTWSALNTLLAYHPITFIVEWIRSNYLESVK